MEKNDREQRQLKIFGGRRIKTTDMKTKINVVIRDIRDFYVRFLKTQTLQAFSTYSSGDQKRFKIFLSFLFFVRFAL